MAGICAAVLARRLPVRLPVTARSMYTARQVDKPVLVLGVVEGEEKDTFDLTPAAHRVNTLTGGDLASRLAGSGGVVKAGGSRVLGKVHEDVGQVVVVGLGKGGQGVDKEEEIHKGREAVRNAAAAGVRAATDMKAGEVNIEDFGDSEAAGEGAALANWVYQQFKKEKKTFPAIGQVEEVDSVGWENGLVLGNSQNLARQLMEAPANFLTPTQFCLEAEREMAGLPVELLVREEEWAKEMGMGSFLSVSRGSIEPAKFLEMKYSAGGDSKPVVLVGKGVTFDTGGISIKPSGKMDAMRADMGGAATVTATMKAVASMGMKVNLVVLVPLTENMPGGAATKPGDVVTAMNGVTIQVDNTDAEGRLILADALCYADTLEPRLVMDVATLTGAMSVALGTAATGVFSNKGEDFSLLAECGTSTGDRVWRMPLWQTYKDKMKNSPLADLNNISLTPGGGSCTAAGFLANFTTCPSWMHLDIAGVMENGGEVKYLGKGMSGRPTRTMVKFVEKLAV